MRVTMLHKLLLISTATIALSVPTTIPPSNLITNIVSSVSSSASSFTSTKTSTFKLWSTSMSTPEVDKFYDLAKEFFHWKLRDFPQYATHVGMNDDTAAHLDKLNPRHFKQRRLKCEDFVTRLQKIDTSTFSEEDYLNYEILVEDINTYLRNFKYLKYFSPISFISGPQHSLKFTLQKYTSLKEIKDFHNLLSRYSEFGRQSQEIIEIMKGQISNGLMPSNWSLKGVSEQLSKLQVPLNESFFYEPFVNISINITPHEKDSLKKMAEKIIEQDIYPYVKKLQDFFKTKYLPNSRSQEGVSSLPGGLDFYKACLKYHTTTNLSPKEIHNIGLREVERINKEVSQTAIDLGFPNMTIGEISRALQQDPTQYFSSKEDLLNTYSNAVHDTIYPLMNKIVNKIPSSNITISESSVSGYASYGPPPADGSKPGIFNINADNFEKYKRFEVIALSLHEAIPGHHLQFSKLITNPSIPQFRKFPDHYRYGDVPAKFPIHTVYIEGWALYAEYLGNELGLFQDPYQRLGRHSFELLRASRLVVDTGIHALKWTRQEAIDYLKKNTAFTQQAIEDQIDRYITWPGQACAYKIGEIKIKELRQKAERKLQDYFRLQDFHEVLLKCAAPLNILEGCVDRYISKIVKS